MTSTCATQEGPEFDHWQVVENVVAAIERVRAKLPGMTIVQKAMVPQRDPARPPREVDVLVTVAVGERNLRIAVDVKDEKTRLDVTMMEQLSAKRAKIQVDRFCVCSVSGWTAEARVEAERNGIELVRLEEFDTSEFWAVPRQMQVVRNQIQILAARLLYADQQTEDLARTSLPSSPEQLLVKDHTATATFSKFLLHWGLAALKQFGDRATDQLEFTVEILLTAEKLYDFIGLDERLLPRPSKVLARYRLHCNEEQVEQFRFRLEKTEVSSSVIENFLGEDRQVSIVAAPTEDGVRQLAVSIGPAKPKRTQI